jgi:hypothetical protein
VSNATSSIAHALAKSGLHIASSIDPELPTNNSTKRLSNRSPWLVRSDDSFLDDDFNDDDAIEDEEDDTDSEEEHLPVTGFAVASNRRQAEFHALFPAVDEGDYLIEGGFCRDGADQITAVLCRRIFWFKADYTSRKTTCASTPIYLAGSRM